MDGESRCSSFVAERVSRPTVVRLFLLLLLGLLAGNTGCRSTQREGGGGPALAADLPLPEYETVRARIAEQTDRLERLQTPLSVRLISPDRSGTALTEQVEGNLQVMRPSSVALRIDKVGQTVFYVGSNDESYWWFDLGDEKVAYIGRLENATPEKAQRMGVPVHPLDLPDLLGLTPLPAESDAAWPPRVVRSADNRRIGVEAPARWGMKRLWLNPSTYAIEAVELYDEAGVIAAVADLSNHAGVRVRGDAISRPVLARRAVVRLPASESELRLTLPDSDEAQNPAERLRTKAFDLALLLEAYGIERTVDLDDPAVFESNPEPR